MNQTEQLQQLLNQINTKQQEYFDYYQNHILPLQKHLFEGDFELELYQKDSIDEQIEFTQTIFNESSQHSDSFTHFMKLSNELETLKTEVNNQINAITQTTKLLMTENESIKQKSGIILYNLLKEKKDEEEERETNEYNHQISQYEEEKKMKEDEMIKTSTQEENYWKLFYEEKIKQLKEEQQKKMNEIQNEKTKQIEQIEEKYNYQMNETKRLFDLKQTERKNELKKQKVNVMKILQINEIPEKKQSRIIDIVKNDEIKQFESYLSMKFKTVLYDTSVQGYPKMKKNKQIQHDETQKSFQKSILNKPNLIFIIQTDDGKRIGQYLHESIKKTKDYFYDEKSFLFVLPNIHEKTKRINRIYIDDNELAFELFDESDEELFFVGSGPDLCIQKYEKRTDCYSYPNSFSDENAFMTFTEMDSFTTERIIVLQFE